MPRDLPGLYWDEDKQRYFSIASRPGAAAATEPRSPAPAAKRKRPLRYERTEHNEEGIPFHQWRRRSPMWAAAENLARSTSTASRSRIKHEVLCSNVMFASNDLGFHLNHPISSFSVNKDTESRDEQFLVSIGDNQGWLHSVEIDSSNFSHRRDLGLLSEVSSVCHWKTRLIAVSFGTPCKLVVGRAHNHEYDAWQLLHLPEHVYDVRTAHLYGSRLVLGAARKGVLIPDLDASVRTVNLGTDNSDVLAVHQQEHLIYVGARSGAIGRFDVRTIRRKNQPLLPDLPGRGAGSVLHLDVVREWQLLVSTVDGDLKTHDLRFLRNTTPLLQFTGHVNSYSLKLGIAVDPAQDLLFAAGQDQRIRAWSLHDGTPLDPTPEKSMNAGTHPLLRAFYSPVVGMQVTESKQGLRLWVASGNVLHHYQLGRRERIGSIANWPAEG